MLDLNYRVEEAEPLRFAAAPTMRFRLRISESRAAGSGPTPIHSVGLRCQVRIEPARRSYTPAEKDRLLDLFGTPERWGQTLRSMLWTHVGATLPPFEGEAVLDLNVPCSLDFSLAATKYFEALDGGDLPLCFLFSGTIFYRADDGALQVAQVPCEKESEFRLPVSSWRALMDHYYPNTAWLALRRDVFDRLDAFRRRRALTSWEGTLERLLDAAGEPATP
jgi:hypothetical protein